MIVMIGTAILEDAGTQEATGTETPGTAVLGENAPQKPAGETATHATGPTAASGTGHQVLNPQKQPAQTLMIMIVMVI